MSIGPNPTRQQRGGTILGPRNLAVERQHPDLLAPPATDHGTLPNLKFAFDQVHTRLEVGGWSREVTVRELPVATTLAAVDMRLNAGGVRELHWHKQAEWAYVLEGRVRVTAIDAEGRNFVDDVERGDLWYFPAGIPHSLQGLGQDGAEFLLVFDDGAFSENSTFLLSDWVAHTPRSVLRRHLGAGDGELPDLPEGEKYIFEGPAPGPLELERAPGPAGSVPNAFTYRLHDRPPLQSPCGRVWIADSSAFAVSTTVAAALVEVEPGGMRELHWHPTADEWQYYLSGSARMGVFAAEGRAGTFDYQAGDVGYVPFPMGHYVQNTGDVILRFLELFRSARFADVSLRQWLALTPETLVRAHLGEGAGRLLPGLPREKRQTLA